VSNADTKADVARGDHEDVAALSRSSQTGHFIKWKRAKWHTLLHQAGYLLLGLVSLATVTGLYFWLDVPLVAAAFTYLVVLVLLALVSNLSSLIVLSFIGVGCLSYFFAPPIYSFRVDYPQDIVTISAFVITSFVVNFLVTRVRVERETLRDANQSLEVANEALRIENLERKRAEQGRRESEDKLRQIIETVPGLIWSASPAGEPTHFNHRLLDYSGMRLEEFQHGGWKAFLHPADFPETARAFYRAIQTGTSYDAAHRLRRSDGEYRWHHVRGEPLRDRDGRIVQWYGLSVDIDEGKKAEDRLRRSEMHLAVAQRLSQTGSFTWKPSTNERLWSDEIYRIFDIDPAQGPDIEKAFERVDPDQRDHIRRLDELVGRGEVSMDEIIRLLFPDGSIKFIHLQSHALRGDDGEFEVVGALSDITKFKAAEDALRESERRSRSAIDGIAGLIAILAPNGEVETVNRQVLEYFGRSLEWLRNWGTNDAVHPEDLPRVLELVKRAMASGIPYHYELRLRRFDGEYRWFDDRGVPIRDDSGRIARWCVLLTDIEDRTRALARLEQMQSDFAHINRVSMMGELAASLSHEITQPIASARNNARAAQNFLDMQPPDLSEIREALSSVVGDTDRAGDIVDRIRDHIKKTPPRKVHFDLNEAINEVIVLGRSAIIKNGVSVQTRLSEGLFPIHCDRVQLQQVVLNLILNAAEAMGSVEGAPRDLLISTEQHHTVVLVAVRDSGPGIDPTNLERVFEAFYTTKSRGVGMGLSICRSIIDAHGGRLWAEANEPRGTIFQFTLPAVLGRA
jgi:PAS domain S-box-containing protein